MLKILKASAGSGKTYSLAKEYIRLIIGSDKPDAYRHVLAVTFTNKATDEMKRRILKELHTLAKNPEESPYLADLLESGAQPDAVSVQKRAGQQLHGILHDYSSFAVSTIDKFFQQTLRAFSREIGQFSSYQVQLDREALVQESVDRVLDSLSEDADQQLLDWLTRSVQEDIRQNGKFSLERPLTELAKSLKDLPQGHRILPREELEQLRRRCREVEDNFQKRVSEAAAAALSALEGAGVNPADSNRGFLKALYNYTEPSAVIKKPTDSFLDKAGNPELWFSKAKAALKDKLHGALDAPLQAFLDCFGLPFKEYNTARTIRVQLYSLGVAGELREAFVQIQREKNVLSLDDSNVILRGIIDGTDAPFIYEKLGVRYDDFLLDEFQDTAEIQWENFRPLLDNSLSGGNDSLVVGDVKQSIYRWRGSEWDLLDSRLEREFRSNTVEHLDGNHRTCRAIVEFNNDFFKYAASELDRLLDSGEEISQLYSDVAQKVCFKDPAPGSVEVQFTEDQPAEISATLQDLRDRGAKWADIAILVRGNEEGSAIAADLVRQNIPVVSDDSLYVKSSVTVRRLVSQLSLADAPPQDSVSTVAGYLARSMQVDIPQGYHSLVDLCEAILRNIHASYPETFESEIPYIQSFMDYLQDWVSTGGNNLGAFLKNWEEATPKIASPEQGDSVRIMTIHKAKGLEFPFVIFPYAERVNLYKGPVRWCSPHPEEGSSADVEPGIFRVSLDSGTQDSFFAADYAKERFMQAVDNINVFYVALTRAVYGLKIIAALPPKNLQRPGNFSQLLYDYVGGLHYQTGEPYDPSAVPHKNIGPEAVESGYASYPADAGRRLKFSPEAADYFGGDGTVGPEASARIRGTVLHDILSGVNVADDLPEAVQAAVKSGDLPASLYDETLHLLEGSIASVADKGWFSPSVKIRSEAAIIGTDGNEYRPDRVVFHPDGSIDVVDYKFGQPKESYLWQVRRYVNLYRKMGYKKVAGYLWYLEDNLITFVS